MRFSAALKALALVLFLGAVAGATYAVNLALGDQLGTQLVAAQPAHERLNGTAGHTVTFPVTVHNRGAGAVDVTVVLAAEGIEGRSSPANVPSGGNLTVFVPVAIPGTQAPGDHALAVSVQDAEGKELRRRDAAATLRVLEPGTGLQPGQGANVHYVGRLASDGRVFNTNDPALLPLNFPKTDSYQPSRGALEVITQPRPSVVQGFYEGLLGMQPGESRTVTFPAEKGYGNSTIEEYVPRERVIERVETLDLPEAPLSLASFTEYLSSTDQGTPDDYEVGELVRSQRENGEVLRYALVEKNEEGVVLRLHVEVGERYSLYPFWPNGSVVESVSETTATFVTTPTTGEDAFTFFDHWPEMSRVVATNETSVTVRHDPPAGLAYQQSQGQFAPPVDYTVVSVGEEEIVVTTRATHQLAGQALTFDILLLEIVAG